MLGGQNFRGGHQGGLHAVLNHRPAQGRRHGGFAAAHIPLDQPVHGRIPGHIVDRFLDGPMLGSRQGEGEQLGKPLGKLLLDRVQVFLFSSAFNAQQPQLQHQEFLKGQAEAGSGDFLLGFGKVNGL